MNLLNLFNIRKTYEIFKAEQFQYDNGQTHLIIKDLKIDKVWNDDGTIPNVYLVHQMINFAVDDLTTRVKQQFGF